MKPQALPRTTDQIVGEYLLTTKGVCAKVQFHKTKLMEMVKAGEFPQPKQIGSQNFWRGADVDSWIRETFATVGPVVQLRAVR